MTEMQNGSAENHASTTQPDNKPPDVFDFPTTPPPVASEPNPSTHADTISNKSDHAHVNGNTFEEGPPSKRRKTADTATTETPPTKPKPPSPPWKKFAHEGPAAFKEDGKRKSARTNRVPLELQPPGDKRQTRAALQSTQPPKSKHGDASKNNTKSLTNSLHHNHVNGKHTFSPSKGNSHHQHDSSKRHGTQNANKAPTVDSTPTRAKRKYTRRVPVINGQSPATTPSTTNPHQTRKSGRASTTTYKTRGKSVQTSTDGGAESQAVTDEDQDGDSDEDEDDDEETDSDSSVVIDSTQKPQRVKFNVRLPSAKIQHPGQVPIPRRFSSFRDWFEVEGSNDPEALSRKPQSKIREEAHMRRTLLEEARLGGLLSREKSSIYAPEAQEEPPRQYARQDHQIAHMITFQKLLQRENARHRRNAKMLAYEAAEFWRSRQPKTEEERQRELEAQYRAIYQQVRKDLQHKWDMVTAEVERRKLQQWEEEQQVLGKEALNKVLEQSTQLLDRRRRRGSSSGASSGSDERSDGNNDASGSDEASENSEDEANMSSSQSDSGNDSTEEVVDDDAGLSREELLQKYANVRSPSVERSPVPIDGATRVHDPGGPTSHTLVTKEDDVRSPVFATSDPQAPSPAPQVDDVDDVLMDDTDQSTDMDDDMGDSDEDGSSGDDDNEDAESNASDEEAGLLGFFNKQELCVAQDETDVTSMQHHNSDDDAEVGPRIPDAAQVQTPAASNGEDSAAETLKIKDEAHPSARSPLHNLMNVKSIEHEESVSLPTTPVSAHPLKTPVPSLLRGTLREYQHYGLDWLAGLYANGTNGILADEMGLGKTIQTISLLAHLAVEHEVWGPHLVVVPTSVMLNWEMEFKKFLPGFKVLTYYGTQEERKQKRQGWNSNVDKWNVWITSYQLALKDDQVFKRREWHYMVLDEAHNIKNFRSKRWQTLLTFNTRARLLLTGTPLQNNLMELWSLLYFLMPADAGIAGFADLQEFMNWFRKPVEQILEHGRDAMDDESKAIVAKLHHALRPFLLRRLKADVEKQMPGKFEHVVYCRLSKRQRYLYDGFMSRAQTRETLASGNYLSIINCLMQLRKVCNHPDLFETRQIVTSFAMPKPAIAGYEIKELLVRRRLLHEGVMDKVDLNVINLLLGANEQMSALDTVQKLRWGALGTVRQHVRDQWARVDQSMPLDGSSVQSVLAHMENTARLARFHELQHAAYLTSLRSQRRPLYSKSLMERLTVRTGRLPLDRPPARREELSTWWTDSSSTLAAMIPTLSERSQAMETTIQKFACVTPVVAASDMAPLALSSRGVEIVREAQRLCPDDAFHEARMRLSIAFPDKRLLQYDCGKLQRLDSLLRTLQAGKHRALIFTQMTKVLDILEQFLNIHGHLYLRLDGSTKIEQRQILTERFNSDPRILCFILSSRSGGLGINLTGADSVIFYDLDWNPAMDKQCQDRCHRIGQTRDVHIYRFVSEHTIEANILRKANQKRMLDDVVIQEGEFTTDYFNKPGVKGMLDDDNDAQGYSGDAEADAAMDRILGGRTTGRVFEQAEDQEDIAAARVAEKELVQTDAADFEDKVPASSGGGATPNTPGPATPGELMPPPSTISKQVEHTTTMEAADSGLTGTGGQVDEDEEEEGGHIDEFMLRFREWELRDTRVQLPVDKSKKKSKKAAEHGVRKRRRKMRCSKTYPCYNCSRFSRNCVFVAFEDPEVRASMTGGAKSDDSASHSQMSEDEDARLYFPQILNGGSGSATASSVGQAPQLSPWATEALYDGIFDADAEDDLMDMGLQIGRLCISERIGGLFRPGMGEMLETLIVQKGGRVPERPEHGHSGSMVAPVQNLISTGIEPSFDLLLPTSQAPTPISVDSVVARTELDMLYHQYFRAVDPLAHVVHKPTFDRQFCRVMLGQYPSKTATKSFTALVLAMCFAAAVSMTNSQPQIQFQTNKTALVDKLKLATERALVAAQSLNAVEKYRDPNPLSLEPCPLECHIRGLLWYQICFLDLHTCEAQGPQPMIHDDDFDTPLPMNVDDLAFEVSTIPVPSTTWTDATFSLIRFEITEIHKSIFRERMALNRKVTDLPTVRTKLESRIKNIKNKYLDNLDDRIPIRRCAKLAATSLLSRCTPMLIQIFLKLDDFSDTQREIQHTMLNSSLDMMEASATLETATDLIPWAWYAPTYQQYHSIFLPLVMLYINPNLPEAARASAMIDHVFGTCYGVSRQQRCGDILRMLANECSAFMKLRKVKHMPKPSSSRASEASPPNVEKAFEDYRLGQGQSGALEGAAVGNGVSTGQGTFGVDTQALRDFMSSQAGTNPMTMEGMTMDEWWSLPDQIDFTDPLFNFQDGV
ncbi:MAG: hypothetical protein Q9218_006443 [Villophora microphyllina]